MLKLAKNKDINIIKYICDGDLLGTRIVCYALAYGFDRDFLQIWFDEENDVVVAKFFDSITVSGNCNEAEEIAEFIGMIGFKSLEISLVNCEILGLTADTIKKSYIFTGVSRNYGAVNICEDYYKSLYSLISENISGSFESSEEAYLSFISDLTFRHRRGLARCRGIISQGKLVSSVITSAETHNCAIISGVTSDKIIRGQGFGKKTVMSMVDELINEKKTVFVVALNETAESFYEHLGFEFNGKIATVLV